MNVPRAEPDGTDRGLATATTIGDLLDTTTRRFPDHTALVFRDHRQSYAALSSRVNRIAHGFLRLGLNPGDRVALLVDNCDLSYEILLGCARAGLVFVPVNTMLREREILQIVGHAAARAFVVGPAHRATVEAIRPRLTTVEHVIHAEAGPDRLDGLTLDMHGDAPPVSVDSDDVLCLLYTSGTTGLPKGVMLTHANLVAHAVNARREYQIDSSSVVLVVLPYFVGAALNATVIPAWAEGGTVVMAERYTNAAFFGLIARERVTHVQVVPTILVRLLESGEIPRHDLTSLKVLGYGSAPMPVDRLRQALHAFGPRLLQIYGLTETCAMATCLQVDEHVLEGDPRLTRRLRSCGRPVAGVDVRIVDDADQPLPTGVTGEIVIRGPTVTRGYWEMPEATAEALRNGWFHTGDVGYVDEDGFVYITDRQKDLIISGGINVSPKEVEEVIYTHPAVFECAVIGRPDPEWGEAVTAVVALKPGAIATEEEIIAYCRERLAGYKKPRAVFFVDEIPRNPSGKVLKRVLRARFAPSSGAQRH